MTGSDNITGSISILLLGLLFITASLQAEPDLSGIDDFVHHEMVTSSIPGIALTVFTSSEIIHRGNYGIADQSGRPVTSQTPFVIGSLSKYITAFAVTQLVDQGVLDLDAPVTEYLPWFRPTGQHAATPITPRHLLGHASGIPGTAGIDFRAAYEEMSLIELARTHAAVKLNRPVGTSYEYSNANYNLLGSIVAAVSGQSFADYIQSHIFVPIGMENSHTTLDSALKDGLAEGHRSWFLKTTTASDYPYVDGFLPSMTLMSSVEDQARFVQATQSNKMKSGEQLLSNAVWHNWLKARPGVAELDGFYGEYGRGFLATEVDGHPAIFVQGGYSTFRAYIFYMPDEDIGLAILMNKNTMFSDGGLTTIPRSIARHLVGAPLTPTPPDSSFWQFLGVLLFIALTIVVRLARTHLRSRGCEKDRGISRSLLLPLAGDGLIVLVLLIGLPVFFGILRSTMMFIQPDLTWSIYAISALAGSAFFVRIVWALQGHR